MDWRGGLRPQLLPPVLHHTRPQTREPVALQGSLPLSLEHHLAHGKAGCGRIGQRIEQSHRAEVAPGKPATEFFSTLDKALGQNGGMGRKDLIEDAFIQWHFTKEKGQLLSTILRVALLDRTHGNRADRAFDPCIGGPRPTPVRCGAPVHGQTHQFACPPEDRQRLRVRGPCPPEPGVIHERSDRETIEEGLEQACCRMPALAFHRLPQATTEGLAKGPADHRPDEQLVPQPHAQVEHAGCLTAERREGCGWTNDHAAPGSAPRPSEGGATSRSRAGPSAAGTQRFE